MRFALDIYWDQKQGLIEKIPIQGLNIVLISFNIFYIALAFFYELSLYI